MVEAIQPSSPEALAERIRGVVEEEGGDASSVESAEKVVAEWEKHCAFLQEALAAFRRDQLRRTASVADRKNLSEILASYKEVGPSSPSLFLPGQGAAACFACAVVSRTVSFAASERGREAIGPPTKHRSLPRAPRPRRVLFWGLQEGPAAFRLLPEQRGRVHKRL